MGLLDDIERVSKEKYINNHAGPSNLTNDRISQQSKKYSSLNTNRKTKNVLNDDEFEEYLDDNTMLQASQGQKKKKEVLLNAEDDLRLLAHSKVQKMSLEELRETVCRFGFRPSKSRKTMIDQLEKVYDALEKASNMDSIGDSSSIFSSSPPSSILLQPLPTPRLQRNRQERDQQTEIIAIDSDSDLSGDILSRNMQDHSDSDIPVEMGDLTMEMLQEQRRAREKSKTNSNRSSSSDDEENSNEEIERGSDDGRHFSSDDEEDDEDSVEPGNTSLRGAIRSSTTSSNQSNVGLGTVPAEVAKQLHDIIKSNEDLYRRILLFEPISFDEVNSLAKRAGVQGLRNKETLRNWLDVQCICFYSTELTGRRQRY